ncbi:hypothetical protein EYC80_009979 [Monilinia laxa]|uniref:Hydrophobin n=1 Tax=Monilinia laxa TaxID=61186 RepID=A0A5N6JR88_MONLA|nr:hypothetical protein EYC80_009979 [Monilinia laxa]
MKLSSIAILAIAISSASGIPANSTFTNSTAIDSTSSNDTAFNGPTSESQPANIIAGNDTDDNASANGSLDDAPSNGTDNNASTNSTDDDAPTNGISTNESTNGPDNHAPTSNADDDASMNDPPLDNPVTESAPTPKKKKGKEPSNDNSKLDTTAAATDPMGSAIAPGRDSKTLKSDRPSRRRQNKLCSGRLKPRCCDHGGRFYNDGCERLSPVDFPMNRSEFRNTCREMDKTAMCCANSLDMASVGIMCRKTVR